jgi:hypothetical protein
MHFLECQELNECWVEARYYCPDGYRIVSSSEEERANPFAAAFAGYSAGLQGREPKNTNYKVKTAAIECSPRSATVPRSPPPKITVTKNRQPPPKPPTVAQEPGF